MIKNDEAHLVRNRLEVPPSYRDVLLQHCRLPRPLGKSLMDCIPQPDRTRPKYQNQQFGSLHVGSIQYHSYQGLLRHCGGYHRRNISLYGAHWGQLPWSLQHECSY